MPSGVPKGENCEVDMDSKAGDLFAAEDAHPTGTGGAGVLSKYESQGFYFFKVLKDQCQFSKNVPLLKQLS